MSEPLVSVVTPFHNTAPYLAQCIESVLTQSYSNFEYILVDNCSTDGGGEIAERYARRDPRIRLVRRQQLLSQVQNYNAALTQISEASKYCKIVQADDYIFQDCLRLMVQAFEKSESIGLVSAYDLKGNVVRGSGFPLRGLPIPGKEVAQLYLRRGVFVFGSPTTVMYRSSIVRRSSLFYDESLLHEDTEKCVQILQDWDFGFVYQVLSFLRLDEKSISGAFRSFQPDALDRYIVVSRYASVFLEPREASNLQKQSRHEYYAVLGQEAVRLRGAEFLRYHRDGLKTVGQSLDWPRVATAVGRELLRRIVNPGSTVAAAMRLGRRWISKEKNTPMSESTHPKEPRNHFVRT